MPWYLGLVKAPNDCIPFSWIEEFDGCGYWLGNTATLATVSGSVDLVSWNDRGTAPIPLSGRSYSITEFSISANTTECPFEEFGEPSRLAIWTTGEFPAGTIDALEAEGAAFHAYLVGLAGETHGDIEEAAYMSWRAKLGRLQLMVGIKYSIAADHSTSFTVDWEIEYNGTTIDSGSSPGTTFPFPTGPYYYDAVYGGPSEYISFSSYPDSFPSPVSDVFPQYGVFPLVDTENNWYSGDGFYLGQDDYNVWGLVAKTDCENTATMIHYTDALTGGTSQYVTAGIADTYQLSDDLESITLKTVVEVKNFLNPGTGSARVGHITIDGPIFLGDEDRENLTLKTYTITPAGTITDLQTVTAQWDGGVVTEIEIKLTSYESGRQVLTMNGEVRLDTIASAVETGGNYQSISLYWDTSSPPFVESPGHPDGFECSEARSPGIYLARGGDLNCPDEDFACYDVAYKWSGNTVRTVSGMVEQTLPYPYPYTYTPTFPYGGPVPFDEQQITFGDTGNWRPNPEYTSAPPCQYSSMTRILEIGDIGLIIQTLMNEFHAALPATWDDWVNDVGTEITMSATFVFENICVIDFFYRMDTDFWDYPGPGGERGFALDGYFVIYYALIDSTGGTYPEFAGWKTYTNDTSVGPAYDSTHYPGEIPPPANNVWANALVAAAAAESNQLLISTDEESTKAPDNLYNGTYGRNVVEVYTSAPAGYLSTDWTIEDAFPGAAYFEGNHTSADWAALVAAYNAA